MSVCHASTRDRNLRPITSPVAARLNRGKGKKIIKKEPNAFFFQNKLFFSPLPNKKIGKDKKENKNKNCQRCAQQSQFRFSSIFLFLFSLF